ncbi:MAG: CobB/CobQ domain protein glutamine amidotransferase [Blastococcus sp.]|nr:CobB/CobQ domain protein glutamine amidotransferase [Blastococcus sp.]
MTDDSAVRVVLLLPDVLGTYSDRGNATVLVQRLRMGGMPAEVMEVSAQETAPTSGDVYVLGGGEDAAQAYAVQWLRGQPALLTTMRTTQVLAVCAGMQVLGDWMQDSDGRRTTGAGVLDLTTSAGPRRAVGEVLAECTDRDVQTLTGFENHRGRTYLGPGVPPLGRVLSGTGNGDGADGVLTANVVGTYLHGPVLARNPTLADFLLRRATGQALSALEVPDQEAARRLHLGGARRRRLRSVLRRS